MYNTCPKYYKCMLTSSLLYTVSLSDFETLQEQVKELIELIHKLVEEFQAVKHEVEASHLDILDSMQLAVAACKVQHSSTS